MTTEKMNVHKALVELKTLDSRIEKEIDGTKFVTITKHANTKIAGVPITEYAGQIRSSYQKVTDLIARRSAIKRAVVLSNARTEITVAGRVYTVAEAIEMKNHGLALQQQLLKKMESDLRSAVHLCESGNGESLERRAADYVAGMCGSADMKNLSEELKKLREDFIAAQTIELVDPLNIRKAIAALEEQISTFLVEVDAALSVSNAITEIEIAY